MTWSSATPPSDTQDWRGCTSEGSRYPKKTKRKKEKEKKMEGKAQTSLLHPQGGVSRATGHATKERWSVHLNLPYLTNSDPFSNKGK